MKQIIKVILLVGLLSVANSCGVVKNKRLEKRKESEKISNDIKTSTIKVNSLTAQTSFSKKSDHTTFSEEINIKRPEPINSILVANFKIDSSTTIKGDTVKLVDVRNSDVSLSIYQHGKTKELMAKVTTGNGSRVTPFSEISIKRLYTNKKDSVDSIATFANHSEIIRDSLDQSVKEKNSKEIVDVKKKETNPDWIIWGLAIFVVAFFIILGFRKK